MRRLPDALCPALLSAVLLAGLGGCNQVLGLDERPARSGTGGVAGDGGAATTGGNPSAGGFGGAGTGGGGFGGAPSGGMGGTSTTWTLEWASDGDEAAAFRVAVSPAGDIVVAGDFTGTLTVPGLDSYTALAGGPMSDRDAVVVGLTAEGTPTWGLHVGDSTSAAANAEQRCIGLHHRGTDVYASCEIRQSVKAGSLERLGADNFDVLVMRLAPADGSVVAHQVFEGSAGDRPRRLAMSPLGDLVVAGWFGSSDLTLGGTVLSASDGLDGFVAELDPVSLLPSAARAVPGMADQLIDEIAINGIGETFLAGWRNDAGALDMIVGKYTGTGDWEEATVSLGNNQEARGLVHHPSDVLLALGSFDGTLALGALPAVNSDGTQSDMFLAAFDPSDGTPLWLKRFGGVGTEVGYKLVLDDDNTVVLVGSSSADMSFGGEQLDARGGHDVVWARVDVDGNLLASGRHGGADDETPRDAGLMPDGSLAIVGRIGTPDRMYVARFPLE